MRRHNELFAKVFERAAERNIAGSKRAKAAATHLRKCFGKAEMDDDDPMEALAQMLEELASEQADDADFSLECCKAFMKAGSGELEKMPRYSVDPQFARLVVVDEDEQQWKL